MNSYNLMGVVVKNRKESASKVQEVFTRHGCLIKVRLGLHEAENTCSQEGFIVLQLSGETNEIETFKNELNSVHGVSANHVSIPTPN